MEFIKLLTTLKAHQEDSRAYDHDESEYIIYCGCFWEGRASRREGYAGLDIVLIEHQAQMIAEAL